MDMASTVTGTERRNDRPGIGPEIRITIRVVTGQISTTGHGI